MQNSNLMKDCGISASYKKLWKLLIDRGLNKMTLPKMAGISSVSMAKLSKNENVTTDVLIKICKALKCDFPDIMEMEEELETQETSPVAIKFSMKAEKNSTADFRQKNPGCDQGDSLL